MKTLLHRWSDLGIAFSVVMLVVFFAEKGTLFSVDKLLWFSLFALFWHQFEKYRYPGYFPGFLNRHLYRSRQPATYPYNPKIAFWLNVVIDWTLYTVAALLYRDALWLGIGTILRHAGRVVMHGFVLNRLAKTAYHPGMLTALTLLLPLVLYFFATVEQLDFATGLDYPLGIILGVVLNVLPFLVIRLFRNSDAQTAFPRRNIYVSQTF